MNRYLKSHTFVIADDQIILTVLEDVWIFTLKTRIISCHNLRFQPKEEIYQEDTSKGDMTLKATDDDNDE